MMPGWVQAGLWGLLGGAALIAGALVGYAVRLPARIVAGTMAFGAGVLISALSFELVGEAVKRGGLLATGVGFGAGAALYTAASLVLARAGARHRKRSGPQQPSEQEHAGSGLAIAVGALLDGIPESVVIGVGMLAGGSVSRATVAAVFLSNLPEGLSSAAGMRKAGRSRLYVFGVWGAIAVASGLASLAGYLGFGGAPPTVLSATTGVAAGAILAMLTDTMIPEAAEGSQSATGLLTACGFLAAFALGHA